MSGYLTMRLSDLQWRRLGPTIDGLRALWLIQVDEFLARSRIGKCAVLQCPLDLVHREGTDPQFDHSTDFNGVQGDSVGRYLPDLSHDLVDGFGGWCDLCRARRRVAFSHGDESVIGAGETR